MPRRAMAQWVVMTRLHRATSCRLHHITSRGNNRRPIYEDAIDRESFYGVLNEAVERSEVLCHVDVLMGNHYHLVLERAIEEVSECIWRVNHRYALAYNRRHARINHLFGQGFHCQPLEDDFCARAIAFSCAATPVRAGFCTTPGELRTSSFRALFRAEAPPPHLSTSLITHRFGPGQAFADSCAEAITRDP